MKKTVQTHIICLFIATTWLVTPVAAQNARATLDTASMLIGDQVNLNIGITVPANTKVIWPAFTDTLSSHIEIIQATKIDTSITQESVTLQQNLLITSFDSGYWAIQPFKFTYTLPGEDIVDSAETEALLLSVNTIPIDTTQAIKDIKGPVSAPVTLAEVLPWVLGGIVFLAAVALILYYFLVIRKKKILFREEVIDKRPPHEIALEAFEKLRKKKLWEQGNIKEFHTALTDILRDYIERRFRVDAPEMTTLETISSLEKTKTDKTLIENLKQVLELADLVKFAKARPLPPDHENSFELSKAFVKETIPAATEIDKKENNTIELTKPEIEK